MKKGIAPRSGKLLAKMLLVKIWSNLNSVLPEMTAVVLFGGMVVLFFLVLADVACLNSQNIVGVTP